MGMIIVPLLLIVIMVIIASLVLTIISIVKKKINAKHWIGGGLISILIYGIIILTFIMEGNIYAFTPIFRFSIFMFILPFAAAMIMRIISSEKVRAISNTILISIIISGTMAIILNPYFFEVADKFGLQQHY